MQLVRHHVAGLTEMARASDHERFTCRTRASVPMAHPEEAELAQAELLTQQDGPEQCPTACGDQRSEAPSGSRAPAI